MGQIVHLKGQVALDPQGQIVGVRDMRSQGRQVLDNTVTVLASMGGRMGDVISLAHYATDADQFMATGDIRTEFFALSVPVSTTIQVQRPHHPDLMTEITAIAEIPRERFFRPPS